MQTPHAADDGTASALATALDRVTPIIVTYNSAHCLPALVPLLSRCPHVILSDNASEDGTADETRHLLPHATILRHPRNLGFGAANNRALDRVETDFALLLNPDCTLTEAALSRLVATADQFPEAVMIAPRIVDGEGRVDLGHRWVNDLWASKGPAAEGPACVGFVTGAAMLIRMSVAARHGFFDERFFLYYEDDDLCRQWFNARLPLIIDPSAQAIHLSRRSVKGKAPLRGEYWRGFHHAQSKLIYTAKYQDAAAARRLRRRLIWQTAAALPLRALAFSPRLLARMWGRMRGVIAWQA
ncbi:glycosyltransferase family 2 protein [Tabrizicola sp. TH137]|uniref:glycosyltransferase family 2 protein n=1 Tax=Tabrizicola sp. TH137 TaxID=2067452 RepID=UPI000C7B78E7|nr:glycosyltransferase family 2 protein [Tabrizicola sp. TH137]PLL14452.1 glycosyltransferase family 2 protein [Tabrizicola sp. TH137]